MKIFTGCSGMAFISQKGVVIEKNDDFR